MRTWVRACHAMRCRPTCTIDRDLLALHDAHMHTRRAIERVPNASGHIVLLQHVADRVATTIASGLLSLARRTLPPVTHMCFLFTLFLNSTIQKLYSRCSVQLCMYIFKFDQVVETLHVALLDEASPSSLTKKKIIMSVATCSSIRGIMRQYSSVFWLAYIQAYFRLLTCGPLLLY